MKKIFEGFHLIGAQLDRSPRAVCWEPLQARRVPEPVRRRGSHLPGLLGRDDVLVTVPIRLAQKDTIYGGDTRSQTPVRSVLSVTTG